MAPTVPPPPLTAAYGAEQSASMALGQEPAQFHVQLDVPANTPPAVPLLYRLVAVGWNAVATLAALPPAPLVETAKTAAAAKSTTVHPVIKPPARKSAGIRVSSDPGAPLNTSESRQNYLIKLPVSSWRNSASVTLFSGLYKAGAAA